MSSKSSTVILLMNLGSPDSYSVKDLRKYLNEFLMDERVIDVPFLARLALVKGIIVPFRAPKSARAYQSIWTENGSPLVHLTYLLKDSLQKQIEQPVEICMRYGNPSPETVLKQIAQKYPHATQVTLFPLYPHYAMSSYETAVEYVKTTHQKGNYPFNISVIRPFYNQSDYINALSVSIEPYLKQQFDLILFSYHGIPERHVKKTDPTKVHCMQKNACCSQPSIAHSHCYRHQVFKTTELVAKQLNIPNEKYAVSFQSRLGRDAWLLPYTAQRLKELPAEGVKHVAIVCPAFVSDCLETIEEMGEEGRDIFLEAGGESFTLIPCLNTHPLWIDAMKQIIALHNNKQTNSVLNGLEHVSVH